MGSCQAKHTTHPPPEYEEEECPICYNKMMKNPWATSDQTFNCQKCNKLFHDSCWCRCIYINGDCPMCRQKIISDDHMKTIRFSQAWDTHHGRTGELSTFIFELSPDEITPGEFTSACYSHR